MKNRIISAHKITFYAYGVLHELMIPQKEVSKICNGDLPKNVQIKEFALEKLKFICSTFIIVNTEKILINAKEAYDNYNNLINYIEQIKSLENE